MENMADIFKKNQEKMAETFEYNPEKEITEKEWKEIKSALDGYRESGEWPEFFELAADVLTIFPDRREELKITDQDDDVSLDGWMKAESELKNPDINTKWNKFFSTATAMGRVFPKRVEERFIQKDVLSEKVLNEMDESFEEEKSSARESGKWLSFLRKASQAGILFPEQFSNSIKDEIQENSDSIIKYAESFKKSGKWTTFCEMAGILKSFGAHLEVGEKEWEGIRHDFDDMKKGKKEGNLEWVKPAAQMASL